MKSLLFAFGLLTILSGCAQGSADRVILEGNYKSVRSVMDPLSCYCFNAGYLTTADGEEVRVCFSDRDKDIPCEQVALEGYYETKAINPGPMSACPAGEMTYLKATAYSCIKL